MFGFADGWVSAAYLLCLASTLLCVVYGLTHWNADEDHVPLHVPTEAELELEEAV